MFEPFPVYFANGEWYFSAPEGEFGPFRAKKAAESALAEHLSNMSRSIIAGFDLDSMSLESLEKSNF